MPKCDWCLGDPLYERYHDEEWGVPVRDDRKQFEFLILEGAQAGLSWLTILKRREGYRKAFKDFDSKKVASFTDEQLEKILLDPGVIRNRLKIYGARQNARAFLKVQEEFDSFEKYLWSFVNGTPIINSPKTMSDVPSKTPLSDAISKDLKRRGFTFVGSTIIYAHLQATGLVNDHLVTCERRGECAKAQPSKATEQ